MHLAGQRGASSRARRPPAAPPACDRAGPKRARLAHLASALAAREPLFTRAEQEFAPVHGDLRRSAPPQPRRRRVAPRPGGTGILRAPARAAPARTAADADSRVGVRGWHHPCTKDLQRDIGLSLRADAKRGEVMHDLDRTNQELNNESFGYEFAAEAEEEAEEEGAQEAEEEGDAHEQEIVSEDEIHEFAAELLEVQSDQEMDQFLGQLIQHVGTKLGTDVSNVVGKSVGRALKRLTRQVSSAVRANGDGELEGTALGLELEGLSHEDREFEVAKQFVRVATDAAGSVLSSPSYGNVNRLAQNAVREATKQVASMHLVPQTGGGVGVHPRLKRPARATRGRWVRRGGKIILFGV
ncbi:hypothetical protein [Sorangium sp. So ce1000]|uniref:hypothetical protein n=1 Tax=Sorangium sp. So ce1000 TaxID=3133325 RepID=UPI003F5FEA04